MDTIKDRIEKEKILQKILLQKILTEAEDIKKRWQEYTEKLCKKRS